MLAIHPAVFSVRNRASRPVVDYKCMTLWEIYFIIEKVTLIRSFHTGLL